MAGFFVDTTSHIHQHLTHASMYNYACEFMWCHPCACAHWVRYLWTHAYSHAWKHTRTYGCTHAYNPTHICMPTHMYVHTHIPCMHALVCIHAQARAHTANRKSAPPHTFVRPHTHTLTLWFPICLQLWPESSAWSSECHPVRLWSNELSVLLSESLVFKSSKKQFPWKITLKQEISCLHSFQFQRNVRISPNKHDWNLWRI